MLSRATPSRLFCVFALLTVSLTRAEQDRSCTPELAEQGICSAQRLRYRKPIRLISRADTRAAGNYREIPLHGTPEAALSERASDVLQKQTGVQVNRAGSPGTQSFLGIRGSGPDQVEYFLEGMPLPKPYNSPLNLETLPLPLFQSVEIFPSFMPSHLPATNIGGAMNFRIRALQANAVEYLTQTYGNSLLGSGTALSRLDPGSMHFIHIEQSRNAYRFTSDNGTPENPADDRTQMQQNEDFSRLGYTLFQRYAASSWRLTALVDINHATRGLPGVANQPLRAVRKSDDRYAAAFSAERLLAEGHRLLFFSSATLDRSTVDDPQTELFFSRGQSSYSPQVIAGGSYAYRTSYLDTAIHVRGKQQRVVLNESPLAARSEGQLAGILAFDTDPLRLALQLSGTVSRDDAARNAFFASAARIFQQNGASISALAALRPLYLLATRASGGNGANTLEIYGQVSSAYRPPSLYERFGDNVFVTPSESLKSENALTNAAGLRGAFACFKLLVCSLRSEAWLTGARDYIIFTQNSARTLIAVNATSAKIWGVENEAMINYPERLLVSLRYTYLDARDFGRIPYYQDKFLPLRPRHHTVASVTAIYASWRFIASVEYRGAIFRDRYNSYSFYLASKILFDAGIDYLIHSNNQHTVNLTVKNILDDSAPDITGFTLPGRYFLLKWTAQW